MKKIVSILLIAILTLTVSSSTVLASDISTTYNKKLILTNIINIKLSLIKRIVWLV